MSENKTEATFHPGQAPVYDPPVVPGKDAPPGGQPDPLTAETWPVSAALREPTTALPIWASSAHRHGTPSQAAPDFRNNGMASWEPEPGEAPRWVRTYLWIWLAVAVAVLVTVTGLFVQRMNWLPASVPLVGRDTGVAACEAIADGRKPVESSGIMSTADYKAAREVFADSRYEAIRTNGTKIIDLAWQAQGMGSNNLGVLALMSGIADAYSGLAGGCASVGYTIPPLGN